MGSLLLLSRGMVLLKATNVFQISCDVEGGKTFFDDETLKEDRNNRDERKALPPGQAPIVPRRNIILFFVCLQSLAVAVLVGGAGRDNFRSKDKCTSYPQDECGYRDKIIVVQKREGHLVQLASRKATE